MDKLAKLPGMGEEEVGKVLLVKEPND
ncbi:predicted protein [Fibroporia radiculosa]|uniref:Uncharacterized protein n=1 Tax=Fibroporia radiculosa TaxID=599839 RepID=J4GIF2_9APHY|nr:predicted protein [Fibroporia radiculosa]